MFGRFWTPPHSRVPDTVVDVKRPRLTRDSTRSRAMRAHHASARLAAAVAVDSDERTPLLSPTQTFNDARPSPVPPPVSPDVPGYEPHHPPVLCPVHLAEIEEGNAKPAIPPFSPGIPGYSPHGRLGGSRGGWPCEAPSLPLSPDAHRPISTLSAADRAGCTYDMQTTDSRHKDRNDKPTRQMPPQNAPFPSEKGVHGVHGPRAQDQSLLFDEGEGEYDKYGLPMYYAAPARSATPDGPAFTSKGPERTRAGWLILLVLALFIGTHTVHVVRTAMHEIKHRKDHHYYRQQDVPRFDTSATATQGMFEGYQALCVDLQALHWSQPFPDQAGINTRQHTWMWLASTHLTLPAGSPILTVMKKHVSGNVGVLGSHSSTSSPGGEIDVLVEVKLLSSASDQLKRTGAWSELKKYELCHMIRTTITAAANLGDSGGEAEEGIELRKNTRAPEDHDDGISFNVKLLLPSADQMGSDEACRIPRMEVGAVRGDVAVDAPGVRFGDVSLWSRDGDVHVGACDADELLMHTGNDGKGGVF